MGKPNNYRCPKCKAKMKQSFNCIICRRCGYTILQTLDRLTEKFIYGG